MSALHCSLCRRPAVWRIFDELFCEIHKENVVAQFGVDRFPVQRLSENEEAFTVRGRYKKPV